MVNPKAEVLKGMLQGCGICPECGCNLIIKKTFFDECFNCNNLVWKTFPKPITKEETGG